MYYFHDFNYVKKRRYHRFTHICIVPSRYNLAYSSGSSIASAFNAQSDPGVVFKFFLLSGSQCGAYSQHWYIYQCCFCVDCILQISFSSYQISLSFNQSFLKNQKHFNQFTMSFLFCVILFYRIFFPMYFPLSEFVNPYGKI